MYLANYLANYLTNYLTKYNFFGIIWTVKTWITNETCNKSSEDDSSNVGSSFRRHRTQACDGYSDRGRVGKAAQGVSRDHLWPETA
jgi:hypothetical protein